MSFRFNWQFFNQDKLYCKAREVLGETMNKGKHPPIIVEKIQVKKLNFGTVAPDLEILEIGDLDNDKFRGIFKLEYEGDASLSLHTTVEANPLALAFQDSLSFVSPQFEFASSSLRLPLDIELSQIRLSAIIILVYSKARGMTLVFRNDPLQSVNVSSTFDFMPGVSKFLRQEIEERLRESFCEDLPEVLYQFSQNIDSDDEKQQPFYFHPEHAKANLQQTHPTVAYTDVVTNPAHHVDLDTLYKCQHTLALFTPGLRDTISRPTLEQEPEPEESTNDLAFNKYASINELDQVLRQTTKHRHVRPKRRVIKLASATKSSKPQPSLFIDVNHAPPPQYK